LQKIDASVKKCVTKKSKIEKEIMKLNEQFYNFDDNDDDMNMLISNMPETRPSTPTLNDLVIPDTPESQELMRRLDALQNINN
jgi:hypothetical protein